MNLSSLFLAKTIKIPCFMNLGSLCLWKIFENENYFFILRPVDYALNIFH